MNHTLPRRHFLRGIGATLALPLLESISPVAARAAARRAPQRIAFVYLPNGVNTEKWFPRGEGRGYAMSPSLEPLAELRNDFTIVRGLAHDKARPNGDGAGDHARANASFLTGVQARKTAGSDIRAGKSVDQFVADAVGDHTPLRSLELGTDKARISGNCDSGYSCAYQFNLAWRSETTPLAPEADPRAVFERLFGRGAKGDVERSSGRRLDHRASILDFVMEDAKRLERRVSSYDQRKVDEYLTAVRETEQRIERAEAMSRELPNADLPDGIPGSYAEHLRLQFDLMRLALETDSTRVATFLMAYDGHNRSFPEVGVREGHHHLSHHQSDEKKLEQIALIDHFYAAEFARFLAQMKAVDEDGSSLLDNSMIVFGGGISDGNRHNHDDLPVIVAGRGGGALDPGRLVKLQEETPMTNLYLSLLDKMGVEIDGIGDSTGRLPSGIV